MHNHLWFTSSAFLIEPGEDRETNTGCYGKALARWISAQLQARGVAVEAVLAEDFGWVVVVARKPFLLWVGCGNEEERGERWGLFVVAEPGLWQRLFKRVEVRPAIAHLEAHLDAIVRDLPDVRDVVRES